MSIEESLWQQVILSDDATIKEAIRNLNDYALKIIMVVDKDDKFIGTVTDGDVRRGLLRGASLDDSLIEIVRHNSFVLPPGVPQNLVSELMLANKIKQVPILSERGFIVGLHVWDAVGLKPPRENVMVIMAGGVGSRLKPYTESCPKPMLEIAGKPMLEHILIRAKQDGFNHFIVAVHYMAEVIERYFGDGQKFGVRVDYLREQKPLGTAGALSLLDPTPNLPFVVTNGDVITDISYGDMLDFHLGHGASATMAVKLHEWQHPFGVVETSGVDIIGFQEKPITHTHINAGVYVINPAALKVIKTGDPIDMPSFYEILRSKNMKVIAYPMHESWIDVGRPDDLTRANLEIY